MTVAATFVPYLWINLYVAILQSFQTNLSCFGLRKRKLPDEGQKPWSEKRDKIQIESSTLQDTFFANKFETQRCIAFRFPNDTWFIWWSSSISTWTNMSSHKNAQASILEAGSNERSNLSISTVQSSWMIMHLQEFMDKFVTKQMTWIMFSVRDKLSIWSDTQFVSSMVLKCLLRSFNFECTQILYLYTKCTPLSPPQWHSETLSGLLTTKREPLRYGDSRKKTCFARRRNQTFALCNGSLLASNLKVHWLRPQSPLHFDLRNI